MDEAFVAMLLTWCGCVVAVGFVRIAMWFRRRQLARLDSDYRAYALIAESKREVRRA